MPKDGKIKSHIKKNKKTKDANIGDAGNDGANYGNANISETTNLAIREILENIFERNYKQEYERYHSKPEQKKRRAQRNKSRRAMEREGKAKKGDGKDVHHKNHDPSDQSSSNLAVIDKSKNRAMNRNESVSTVKKDGFSVKTKDIPKFKDFF